MFGYKEFIKSINLNSDYSIFSLKLLDFAAFAVFITISLFFLLTSENANAIEPKSIYFGEEINISDNNGTSELPQVTAEGNNVYVVWQDNSSGNYDVYFKLSSSDGTKFKSTRNLSKNNGTSQYPMVASYNDVFYIVWKDDSNGKQDIFSKDGRIENLSKSTEYGSLKKLQGIGDASNPQIFAGENFLPTVWSSTSELSSFINIYPSNFFDDSKDAIQFTKSASNGNILNLKISGFSTNAYCVWENKDVLNGDIFFKRLSIDFID